MERPKFKKGDWLVRTDLIYREGIDKRYTKQDLLFVYDIKYVSRGKDRPKRRKVYSVKFYEGYNSTWRQHNASINHIHKIARKMNPTEVALYAPDQI